MLNRRRPFTAGLAILAILVITASAKAETAAVKESALSRARSALVRYDLGADGTLTLLEPLARYATEHKGSGQADEAAFLRAAAASDLWFISEFSSDWALRARLAQTLRVEPQALAPSIAAELRACARGVYKIPAEAALRLIDSQLSDPLAVGPADTHRDLILMRRALVFDAATPLAEHFAASGHDACEGTTSCPEPLASLDGQGRRAFGALKELGAAMARLDRAGRNGDPLAAALAGPVASLRAQLLALRVRLAPRLADAITPITTPGAVRWPIPDVLLTVSEREVRWSRFPLARVAENGTAELVAQTDPVAPQSAPLAALRDLSRATRPIDELVAATRKLRDSSGTLRSAAVIATEPLLAHVLGRALISLDKAGLSELVLLARAADGGALGVPIHVTFAGPSPIPPTDLKLRIRLGGYSLGLGSATLDIPRVKDESGWRFDVERLRAAAAKRTANSAAVSFMPDVAAEQVVVALFQVRPGDGPVELVVR